MPRRALTIGWDPRIVRDLCQRIESYSSVTFDHLDVASTEGSRAAESTGDAGRWYFLREDPAFVHPRANRALLATLEFDDGLSVRNMILSDRVVRELPEEDALAFATSLAVAYENVFRKIAPDLLVGAFDCLHASIAWAVARKLGIPWYALSFSALPTGLTAFCTRLTPGSAIKLDLESHELRLSRAAATVDDFVARRTRVPAYVSANTVRQIIERLPTHLRELSVRLRRAMSGRFDRYT